MYGVKSGVGFGRQPDPRVETLEADAEWSEQQKAEIEVIEVTAGCFLF